MKRGVYPTQYFKIPSGSCKTLWFPISLYHEVDSFRPIQPHQHWVSHWEASLRWQFPNLPPEKWLWNSSFHPPLPPSHPADFKGCVYRRQMQGRQAEVWSLIFLKSRDTRRISIFLHNLIRWIVHSRVYQERMLPMIHFLFFSLLLHINVWVPQPISHKWHLTGYS